MCSLSVQEPARGMQCRSCGSLPYTVLVLALMLLQTADNQANKQGLNLKAFPAYGAI